MDRRRSLSSSAPRTASRRAGRCLAALALLLLCGPPAAEAKTWESEEHNCALVIPDAPAPWDWLPFQSEWTQAHIVRGARRTLTKLKNGKQADGHGAILHLVLEDAPKDKSLADLAGGADMKRMFLTRFGSSAGELEVEEVTVPSGDEGEVPAVILRTEGKSPNLLGKPARTVGVMLVTLAKGKVYAVRMYAFPTEHDEEGLVVDLDYMEGNCLELLKTKEKKEEPPPKPPDEPADGGGDQKPEEEEGQEKVIENAEQFWRITKHKRLPEVEITDDQRKEDLALRLEGSDRYGSFVVWLYAIPHGRIVNGQQLPPPDLTKWMTYTWWQNFTTNHPKGDIFTWKFPRKTMTGAKTWLTLPYLEDEKNRIEVIKGDEARPVEVSASDAEKKYKFVEGVKHKNIGKRGKASEAMRGALDGQRPRVGREMIFRYAWRYRSYSYRLFVSFSREGYKKYGEAVRATLESMEFGVK